MSLFHLSHTDLDGYAAQFVSKFYFQNIKFFNSNYGKEIDDKFELILSEANSGDIILITDLNITLAQCEKFDKLCKEKELRLFLLDNHQSGARRRIIGITLIIRGVQQKSHMNFLAKFMAKTMKFRT